MPHADAKVTSIFLSASTPDLLQPAEAYLRELAGDGLSIAIVPGNRFATIGDDAAAADANLIALALHSDKAGNIDLETAFARLSLDSSTPVMILRAPMGGPVSFPTPKRLVVPVDGSSTAAQVLPLATRMARVTGLPVRFVMVIDPSRVIPPAYAYDPEAYGIISDLRQTAHWALRQAEDQLEREGIEAESELLFGPVNACLCEVVGDGDIVVMTTHGSGQARRRQFGSVAARILASVPQPIVLMRASMQSDVVIDGYEACSWVEPLGNRSRAFSRVD